MLNHLRLMLPIAWGFYHQMLTQCTWTPVTRLCQRCPACAQWWSSQTCHHKRPISSLSCQPLWWNNNSSIISLLHTENWSYTIEAWTRNMSRQVSDMGQAFTCARLKHNLNTSTNASINNTLKFNQLKGFIMQITCTFQNRGQTICVYWR